MIVLLCSAGTGADTCVDGLHRGADETDGLFSLYLDVVVVYF